MLKKLVLKRGLLLVAWANLYLAVEAFLLTIALDQVMNTSGEDFWKACVLLTLSLTIVPLFFFRQNDKLLAKFRQAWAKFQASQH